MTSGSLRGAVAQRRAPTVSTAPMAATKIADTLYAPLALRLCRAHCAPRPLSLSAPAARRRSRARRYRGRPADRHDGDRRDLEPERAVAAPPEQTFEPSELATMPLLEREEITMDVRPPIIFPVGDYAVASGFGLRAAACDACSTDHRGVDWALGYGTQIKAMADGVVSEVGTPGGDRRHARALDDDRPHHRRSAGHEPLRPHGRRFQPARVGDEVRVGDVIGQLGTSGVTTAPHLHFELHLDGVRSTRCRGCGRWVPRASQPWTANCRRTQPRSDHSEYPVHSDVHASQ